jgi:heme oxygenase
MTDAGFARAIRDATAAAHEGAESTPFAAALLAGEAGVTAWTALLTQLVAVYGALEAPAARLAEDPVAGPFVDAALHRVAGLRSDLDGIVGPSWRDVPALPATREYAGRIADVAATWPAGWVAHHYTRYLGDLSGGRMLAGAARRHLGLTDDVLRFTSFDRIGSAKAYKDDYRARLDALGRVLAPAERAAVCEEACRAFAFNHGLFVALGTPLVGAP